MQKVQDTVIRLKDGDKFIDIKTINIQQLVKKFAQSIFRKAQVDIQRGKYSCWYLDWTSINFSTGLVFTKHSMKTTMMAFITRFGRQIFEQKSLSTWSLNVKKLQMLRHTTTKCWLVSSWYFWIRYLLFAR